ncbi:MAG: Ig-like domain repeat protein, partial [Hyphomicrobiales bacterium]|nr:Ig-like domain repeat protein [Hyphomicrobiales bacterium]
AVYDRVLTDTEIGERFDSAAKADTTTTITGPGGDWPEGVDLEFAVTAESTVSSETPSGTVELFSDDTSLGAATIDASGQATFTVQLPGGNHRIWARYEGDDEFVSSRSAVIEHFVTVAEPTDTTLEISAPTSTFGEVVDLTATVTTSAATALVPSGEVVFVADGTEIATALLVDGVGSATVTAGDVGSWNLEARYSGDVNFASSTSPVTPHTVDPAPTTLI